MKITSVSYARLQTLRNFSNERIGATADVEDHESPEDALMAIKDWVHSHLSKIEDMHARQEEVYRLQSEKVGLESDITELRKRWETAKAFLELHGLPPDRYDNVPF